MHNLIDHRPDHICTASLIPPVNCHLNERRNRSTTVATAIRPSEDLTVF